ncbi:hypothetical protein CspHIS471_0509430 [Cutaneotrichosporon sp. HIS471]|nr:hypothetical protein CspHIS471_0509430 [Cutaneotrichosporon sp. HIS471]
MVSSPSPSSPAFTRRPQPKRTYGRRGRILKSRTVSPDPASDTDVDSDTNRATPTASAKRPRTSMELNDSPQTRGGSHSRSDSLRPHATIASPFASTPHASPTPVGPSHRDASSPRPHVGRSRTVRHTESLQLTAPASSLQTNGNEVGRGSAGSRPRRRMLGRAESMHASQAVPSSASAPSTPRTPRPLKTAQSAPTPGSGATRAGHVLGSAPGSPSVASPPVAPLVPATIGSPSPAKAKRTYGGNRSFLANRPADLDTALSEDAQPSYSELRKAYEVDPGDDDAIRDLTEEFNFARAPEPINDMRSKGENRLFMDDIGVLLSDINNPAQSLALRRSSALDVLQKMQEGEWITRLRGHTETVFVALCSARGEDPILNAACLVFLALLAKSGGLRQLLEGEEENVVAVLRNHIDLTSGPLDQGYRGKASLSIHRLRAIASKIFKQQEQDVRGSRGIASYILAEAFQLSTFTPHIQAAIAQEEIPLILFQRLKDDGALLRTRMELYRNSIDLVPRDGTFDLDAVEQSLRALSRIAALSRPDREQLSQERDCIIALLYLFVSMVAIAVDEEEDDETIQRQAARCAVLSLSTLAPLAESARMADEPAEVFESAHEVEATFAAFGRLIFQRNRWTDLCKSTSGKRSMSPSSSPTQPYEDLPSDIGTTENLDAIELLIILSPVLDWVLPTTRSAAITVATTSVSGCGKRECIFGCRCLSSISFASLIVSLYNEKFPEGEQGRVQLLSMFVTIILTRLLVSAQSHVRPLVQRELAGTSWREQLEGLRNSLINYRSIFANFQALVGRAVGVEVEQDGDSIVSEALRELEPLLAKA